MVYSQFTNFNGFEQFNSELNGQQTERDSIFTFMRGFNSTELSSSYYRKLGDKYLEFVNSCELEPQQPEYWYEITGSDTEYVKLSHLHAMQSEHDFTCYSKHVLDKAYTTDNLYYVVHTTHTYFKRMMTFLKSGDPHEYEERLAKVRYSYYNFFLPFIQKQYTASHEFEGRLHEAVERLHNWEIIFDFYLGGPMRKTPLHPERGWGLTKTQSIQLQGILNFEPISLESLYQDFDAPIQELELLKEQSYPSF